MYYYEESEVWVELAWWVIGWGLGVVGGLLISWGLLWDRARGRLRCPSCWYDMRGVGGGGLSCPECGVTATGVRGLKRTRRRWRLVIAGIVPVFLGTQAVDWPRRSWEEGWTKYVPSTVLALMARPGMLGEYGGAMDAAVREALMMRPMRSWQGALAEWRVLNVADQDSAAMVTTRKVWPVGEPVVLRADVCMGLCPLFEEGELEVTVAGAAGETMTLVLGPSGECGCCCCCDDELVEEDDRLVLPGRGAGAYVERVTVRVRSRGWTIARWDVDVAFEVRGTIDDVVKPVSGEAVDAVMRRALRMEEYDVDKGVMYALWVSMDEMGGEAGGGDGACGGLGSDGGAPALKGEVLVDGKVAAKLYRGGSFRVVWDDYEETREDLAECVVRVPRPEGEIKDDEPDRRMAYAREHVRLRLSGDQLGALGDLGSAAYWKGTVEVGVGELMEGR